jgi:hypothetical protein
MLWKNEINHAHTYCLDTHSYKMSMQNTITCGYKEKQKIELYIIYFLQSKILGHCIIFYNFFFFPQVTYFCILLQKLTYKCMHTFSTHMIYSIFILFSNY